jgi:hypothetical protein
MMGRQDEPAQLFYKFSLDRHVAADHTLRQIDAVLDLSMLRRRLARLSAPPGSGRKLKCSSRISSAISDYAGCGCAA